MPNIFNVKSFNKKTGDIQAYKKKTKEITPSPRIRKKYMTFLYLAEEEEYLVTAFVP